MTKIDATKKSIDNWLILTDKIRKLYYNMTSEEMNKNFNDIHNFSLFLADIENLTKLAISKSDFINNKFNTIEAKFNNNYLDKFGIIIDGSSSCSEDSDDDTSSHSSCKNDNYESDD